MSSIYITGMGAVSPAGWGMGALNDAVAKDTPLPTKELKRPSGKKPHLVRVCPAPPVRPSWLAHPRLRRSSPVSQYAMGAALEALQMGGISPESGCAELGIIVAVFSGCVQYSRRFYEEVLADPATASPLIFPETVFNAPASHLGAYLKCSAANYTLVGDVGTFLSALATGANWISTGKVKHCLVVGTEEADWLTAEGLTLFHRSAVLAEGAGAVLLSGLPGTEKAPRIELTAVSDEFLYANWPKNKAMEKVQTQLEAFDRRSWCSVKEIFGHGLMAGTAWEVCMTINDLKNGTLNEKAIVIEGLNQHAIGAKFSRRLE